MSDSFETEWQTEYERVKPGRKEGPRANGRSRQAEGEGSTAKPQAQPFPFTWSKDISLEPKEFLIEGFLGVGETSAWYGPPDAGKSAVMTYATACVAAGMSFCGRQVRQGPVLYVAAERGPVVRRRVKAWCIEHGLPDIPLAILDHAVDMRTSKIDAERIIASAVSITEITGQPVAWIAFDTHNRVLAGGDENSPKDMGSVIAAVDMVQRQTGAHCSLVHHVPHDRVDRMRGHGLVLGAMDMTARITKDTIAQLEVDKANDLMDKPRFAFTFKSVVLCTDMTTGIDTTAPVMVPIEGDAPRKAAKPAKISKAARIALDALIEVLDEQGQNPPASNHIPAGVKVVTVDVWRQQAYQRGISTSKEERARQLAFQRASDVLNAAHHMAMWGNLVWSCR